MLLTPRCNVRWEALAPDTVQQVHRGRQSARASTLGVLLAAVLSTSSRQQGPPAYTLHQQRDCRRRLRVLSCLQRHHRASRCVCANQRTATLIFCSIIHCVRRWIERPLRKMAKWKHTGLACIICAHKLYSRPLTPFMIEIASWVAFPLVCW